MAIKDCCNQDKRPGPVQRVVGTLTNTVLLLLALAALAAVLFKII